MKGSHCYYEKGAGIQPKKLSHCTPGESVINVCNQVHTGSPGTIMDDMAKYIVIEKTLVKFKIKYLLLCSFI